MGWNLKGMPYLVHEFNTYATNETDYQMNVPHVFYNVDTSTGSFSTSQSWAEGAKLTLGDGFLTQTAIIGKKEDLEFKVPVFGGEPVAPARQRISIAHQETDTRSATVSYDDVVDVYPQPEADATLPYRLGSDGIKWLAFNESLAQIYVQNAEGIQLSLVSAAPVETDIALGITVPEEGSYVISLPEPEAYSNYAGVWIIDHLTGKRTNLQQGDFTLTVSTGSNIDDRLTLRFGNMVVEQEAIEHRPSVLKVAARNGRLPLRNISADEHINVYNASGNLVYTGIASECRNTYLIDGVYIIKRE